MQSCRGPETWQELHVSYHVHCPSGTAETAAAALADMSKGSEVPYLAATIPTALLMGRSPQMQVAVCVNSCKHGPLTKFCNNMRLFDCW